LRQVSPGEQSRRAARNDQSILGGLALVVLPCRWFAFKGPVILSSIPNTADLWIDLQLAKMAEDE
jgi:hypothetical protein